MKITTETTKRASGQITESVNGFQRILTLTMPFDRRHPDPNKNYGIHGMDLRMVLHKDDLAVQFVAYLPVHLPHVADELLNNTKSVLNPFKGMGADVGYHNKTPQFESQTSQPCDILEGGECYYNGSRLQAEKWYADFLAGGPDIIWAQLEARWNAIQADNQ